MYTFPSVGRLNSDGSCNFALLTIRYFLLKSRTVSVKGKYITKEK